MCIPWGVTRTLPQGCAIVSWLLLISVAPPFPDEQLFEPALWDSGKVIQAEQKAPVPRSPTGSCSVSLSHVNLILRPANELWRVEENFFLLDSIKYKGRSYPFTKVLTKVLVLMVLNWCPMNFCHRTKLGCARPRALKPLYWHWVVVKENAAFIVKVPIQAGQWLVL